ncbi:MAG: GNAT family N-acetyltransferase [Pseudomonadota bacterium]
MVELSNGNHAYLLGDRARDGQTLALGVVQNKADALDRLAEIPAAWIHARCQDPRVLSLWIDQGDKDPYIISIDTPSGPVILPLEEHDDCTARFIGDRHANGNFPIGPIEAIQSLGPLDRRAIRKALHDMPHAPCSLVLERQLRSVKDLANPFVDAQSTRSPNVALSFSLAGGFDAVLAERNGKRLRKKARSSQRKLESLGVVSVLTADTTARVNQFLGRFFAMKAERFKQLGIFDVFADPATQAVMRAQFNDVGAPSLPAKHRLHALCLDDDPIAVIGCTEFGGCVTVEFGAFDDQHAHASPGDLLFYRAIEHYCAVGFSVFDFGIGEEQYKRRWCDVETWHADTFIAANASGRLIALTQDLRSKAVRSLKTNETVWNAAKRLRKTLAGRR